LKLAESWESSLRIFYNKEKMLERKDFKPSIFLELLAIYLDIDMRHYDLFESLENFN